MPPTEGFSQPSVGVSLPCPRASAVEDVLEPWRFLPRGPGIKGLLGQGQRLFLRIGTPVKSPVRTLCSAVETSVMVTHIPVASRTAHS